MASFLSHPSIIILYYLFPNSFNLLGLFVGSLIPDIEYIYIGYKLISRTKSLRMAMQEGETGILHSILGCIFLCIPISIAICMGLGQAFSQTLLISVIVGIASHLILDMPAHSNIMLFYPFYRFEGNPFLIRYTNPLIKRLYPYTDDMASIKEWSYLLLSNFLPLISLSIYIFTNVIHKIY